MYFFHGDNFSTPILLSRNFAERGRFPSGDVSTEIPIGGLFLQDGIELENEAASSENHASKVFNIDDKIIFLHH